jgi:hypothetical protein
MLMLAPTPFGISGLGAASAAITQLQQALVGLAQASGRPAVNPGAVDGVLGTATMNAVAAGLQIASERVPQDKVVLALNAALTLGSGTTMAKNAVTSYAPQLTLVIKGVTAGMAAGVIPKGTAPTQYTREDISIMTTPGGGALATATPWYKTWWGIGAIAVGAFGAYKFLTTPSKPRAAALSGLGGMTKADVLREFNELYPAKSFRDHRGHVDVIMKREAWSNYTDGLAKDRRITAYQDRTWTNPF